MRRRSPQDWTDDDIARLRSAWAARGTQGACAFDREFCETVHLRSGSVQQKRSELKLIVHTRRTTGIKPANAKRRAAKHARNFGERNTVGKRDEAVRGMECIAVPALREWIENGCPDIEDAPRPCSGDIQACHDTARGLGGCNSSSRELFPGCRVHHDESGPRGSSKREEFEARYSVSVTDLVEVIAIELDARGIP